MAELQANRCHKTFTWPKLIFYTTENSYVYLIQFPNSVNTSKPSFTSVKPGHESTEINVIWKMQTSHNHS